MIAGKKLKRPLKKRFKEDDDFDVPKSKNKHHDRTTWRLLRSEQKEKYGKQLQKIVEATNQRIRNSH